MITLTVIIVSKYVLRHICMKINVISTRRVNIINTIRKTLLTVALLAWSFIVLANTKDPARAGMTGIKTIHWQTIHVPPSTIKSGPLQGQGFVQLVLQQIIAELPDYEHQFPITTLARATSDMKSGKNVCHPALMITEERQKWAYFSRASFFNPNNYLVMSADVADKFTQSPLQLDELTRQPNLIFAVIKNRAYGTSIDNFIAKQLDQQQRLDITSDNLSYMFRLLTVNKVDVTFAYPFEVAWFTKDKPQYRDNLILRPVANQPQFLVGHVTCPKTDWGKQVISRIDEALKNLKPTDTYKQSMTRWWPEQSIDNTFERFYQDHFLKN